MTLLTIDIWDTLLRRRCHPDEVKLFTARCAFLRFFERLREGVDSPWKLFELRRAAEHEIGRRRSAAGSDDEYAIDEVMHEWLYHALAPGQPPAALAAWAEELVQAELQQELTVCFADDRIGQVLATLGSVRTHLVSDFYMRAGHLQAILKKACVSVTFESIYASCDSGLNKRSGRLFERVYQETGGRADAHLHVGDNPDSDVAVPRRLGARAIHYRNPPQDRLRLQHNRRFEQRAGGVQRYVHELAARLAQPASRNGDLRGQAGELYRAGRKYALVFYGFVLSCIEEAAKRNVERLYYFTREGVFFRNIHDRIRAESPLGLPIAASEILEVSRLATFLPSIREWTPTEFMRIWNLYSIQSPSAFSATLGIEPQLLAPHFARHALEMTPRVTYPWQDAKFTAVLADPAFLAAVRPIQQERRDRLLRYLAQRGIRPGQPRLMIVDIGWRGTIQDNLSYLLPETTVYGNYLGLQSLLNAQPANARKRAFGPDENRDDSLRTVSIRCVAPIEMLTNSDTGSITGYVETPEGVVASKQHDPGEDRVHHDFIRHFQQGVLSAVDEISDWVRIHAISADELRGPCLKMLTELIAQPPRVLADAFFALQHNETFGLGAYTNKRRRFPFGLAAMATLSSAKRLELAESLKETGWPQGFLQHSGLGFLCASYNRAIDARIRSKI